MANIEFKQDYKTWRILINGLPHLIICREGFLGIHTYYDSEECYIEIFMRDGKGIIIHEKEENWKEILRLLDANL